MWDLIVSVPDHCLSFYFTNKLLLLAVILKDFIKLNLLHLLIYECAISGKQIQINKVTEQNDLGVLINNKLNCVPYIQAMVKKANRNSGIIHRTFSYIDKTVFMKFYDYM